MNGFKVIQLQLIYQFSDLLPETTKYDLNTVEKGETLCNKLGTRKSMQNNTTWTDSLPYGHARKSARGSHTFSRRYLI